MEGLGRGFCVLPKQCLVCCTQLRTGPCRAVRVCVPAINIDGVDSAQGCLYIQRLGCKCWRYLLCGQEKAV